MTIKDVAALAGVSLGTVSNYLNGTRTVSPDTRARIERAIEVTHFVPNRAVRTLRGNRTHTVGLLVPDAGNPFFTEIARGVEDRARERGDVLVYCDTAGDPERQSLYIRRLAEMRVGGLVISATASMPPDLGDLESVGTPIVVVGGEGMALRTSRVTFDHRLGGELAMRHVLELGHRQILYAGGPGGELVIQARYQGALAALAEYGDAELHRVDATGRSARERGELADEIMAMRPRPTAVLCGNDLIAIAIANKLIRAGRAVPGDVAIVGYDDITDAQLAVVPLTTVRQPAYQIGTSAAELLFERVDDPVTPHREISFAPELIVRDSSGRSPRGMSPGAVPSRG
ncbi:LacI family DNA-binding transcriptional regulator [Kribbella sp. NPDC004875]|uniref:LacI family DNA-binding transcriptional regulator n=1 Tax=Kribbella sp. NPDC004875 TaxID=3364107 RepID=UPI00367BC26E